MTRKNFEAIARAVALASSDAPDGTKKLDRATLIIALSNIFAADNPRFDDARFLKACNSREE